MITNDDIFDWWPCNPCFDFEWWMDWITGDLDSYIMEYLWGRKSEKAILSTFKLNNGTKTVQSQHTNYCVTLSCLSSVILYGQKKSFCHSISSRPFTLIHALMSSMSEPTVTTWYFVLLLSECVSRQKCKRTTGINRGEWQRTNSTKRGERKIRYLLHHIILNNAIFRCCSICSINLSHCWSHRLFPSYPLLWRLHKNHG